MPLKPKPLRHPIRDGLGFIAAAAAAVVQLFSPAARRRSLEVEGDEALKTERSLVKRVVPYPTED